MLRRCLRLRRRRSIRPFERPHFVAINSSFKSIFYLPTNAQFQNCNMSSWTSWPMSIYCIYGSIPFQSCWNRPFWMEAGLTLLRIRRRRLLLRRPPPFPDRAAATNAHRTTNDDNEDAATENGSKSPRRPSDRRTIRTCRRVCDAFVWGCDLPSVFRNAFVPCCWSNGMPGGWE